MSWYETWSHILTLQIPSLVLISYCSYSDHCLPGSMQDFKGLGNYIICSFMKWRHLFTTQPDVFVIAPGDVRARHTFLVLCKSRCVSSTHVIPLFCVTVHSLHGTWKTLQWCNNCLKNTTKHSKQASWPLISCNTKKPAKMLLSLHSMYQQDPGNGNVHNTWAQTTPWKHTYTTHYNTLKTHLHHTLQIHYNSGKE